MNLKFKLASLFMVSAIAISSVSFAASKGPLQISMNAFSISTDANGQEVATQTKEADRKSTIEFRAVYKNSSAEGLPSVMVIGPIPKLAEYQPNSAHAPVDAAFEVSIDGGKTFETEPVKRLVKDKTGKTVETIIPTKQYTHVRWMPVDGIPSKTEQLYTYRVKVK